MRVKVSPGRVKVEHDDAARVARRAGLPLREVLSRAEAAGRSSLRVVAEADGRRGLRPGRRRSRPRRTATTTPTRTTTTAPTPPSGVRRRSPADACFTGGMPEPPETCPACRFDGAEYDLSDSLGTLRALGPIWHETVEGVAEDVLLTRPAPGVWSAAEYTAHAADVTQAMGRLLHGLLTIDDLEVEAVPEGHAPDVSDGFGAALERLTANLARLHDRGRSRR